MQFNAASCGKEYETLAANSVSAGSKIARLIRSALLASTTRLLIQQPHPLYTMLAHIGNLLCNSAMLQSAHNNMSCVQKINGSLKSHMVMHDCLYCLFRQRWHWHSWITNWWALPFLMTGSTTASMSSCHIRMVMGGGRHTRTHAPTPG